jgi:hypothetical protein
MLNPDCQVIATAYSQFLAKNGLDRMLECVKHRSPGLILLPRPAGSHNA